MNRLALTFAAVVLFGGLTACDGAIHEPNGTVADAGTPHTPSTSNPVLELECAGVPDYRGPRLLRRLTHAEYDRTIKDLLGLDSTFGDGFAADNVVGGFFNNAEALLVGDLLADHYRNAAEALAEQAILFRLDALHPCDPAIEGQAYCAASFVRDVGMRAFRRPLNADEVDRYWTLWDAVAREDGYATGLQWVLTAMLQSPHFLYRQELGATTADGVFALTGWEIASQLSYLLWGTMPDQVLFDAAAAGELETLEQIVAQRDRMLADSRAERAMRGFVREWLHLDRLTKVPKVMQVYPDLTFAVRDLMLGETERLASRMMAEGATLAELLTADHSYMTDALADYYGVAPGAGEADAEDYRRVELAGTNYGGLLTQGALTTTFARPDSSGPVHRGVAIRERLLCQHLPPPPPGLEIKPPPMDPTKSTRDRYFQHSSDPACGGCHSRIDGIGFAFEHYDGAGVWRDDEDGLPIDVSGEIVEGGSTSGSFEGVDGLQRQLAGAPEVDACYIQMWVEFGTGLKAEHDADDDPSFACAEQRILSTAGDDGVALEAPLHGITEMLHFRQRVGDPTGGPGSSPLTGAAAVTLTTYEAADDSVYPAVGGGGPQPGGSGEGVELTLTTVSDWPTGYCTDGIVENFGDTDVVWEVSATIAGTINNLWNANMRVEGGLTWFTGASFNAVLAPGGTASFGFCADK